MLHIQSNGTNLCMPLTGGFMWPFVGRTYRKHLPQACKCKAETRKGVAKVELFSLYIVCLWKPSYHFSSFRGTE